MSTILNDADRQHYRYAVLGGGLHGCLAAWALGGADFLIIERAPNLAGNHTWSCHADDLGPAAAMFEDLFPHKWPAYDVAFPTYSRRIPKPYWTTTSSVVATKVRERLESVNASCQLGVDAEIDENGRLKMQGGETIDADWVFDARGESGVRRPGGWQKFLGLEVETLRPHGRALPMVMDARVQQHDGFRFLYVLPIGHTRLLIEDTYYSEVESLDAEACRRNIHEYAEEHGWKIAGVVREERGCLPIPYDKVGDATVGYAGNTVALGYRGGWFHPTTGYSLGLGARALHAVAVGGQSFSRVNWQAMERRLTRRKRWPAMLNRMMFRAFNAEDRWHVLEHFYRVTTDDAVARFYGLESTWWDQVKLFAGRPPRGFSVGRYVWGAGR